MACGMRIIANGSLLDILHRIRWFSGLPFTNGYRQESTRHTDAIAEITRYLGIGDYAQWSEAEKTIFLGA